MPSLIAENLTYSYSSKIKPALSKVSLKLEQGTLTALVGPNGAGKSTLLSLLQGSSKPDQGEITVDGKALRNNRSQVALMPQRGKLNWNFPITVEGLVSLGRVNHSKSTCCELEAALQRVGISHLAKRRLDALSGGQQQRALLAKTLMNSLDAKGVAVTIDAAHQCMTMRGVKKERATTVTNYFLGSFREDLGIQNRYLRYIKK